MKIVAIIQARMGSTRLPGKVMKTIKGITVLGHVVDRLKICQNLNEIVIATTTKCEDDMIVDECKGLGVKYFRGDENDVLSRYYYAAKENNADIVIRITSDCPVIDPYIVDKMILRFIGLYAKNQIDYMSNTLERTFPRGLDAEIFSYKILEQIFNEASNQYEREHVTPYIYQHPEKFKLVGYKNDKDYSKCRWTLDTPEDLEVIIKIYENLYDNNKNFSFDDVINFIKKNPEIQKINEGIEQKKLGE